MTTGTVKPDSLTEHDRKFTVLALTEKADRCEKIAKTASEAGYAKEALVIKGDANYAREELIPAFDPQLSAFPKTEAEAKAGIANILFETIKRDIEVKAKPAETCDKLADKVLAFGQEIYQRAYSAGVADRQEYGAPAVLLASLVGLRNGTGKKDEDEA